MTYQILKPNISLYMLSTGHQQWYETIWKTYFLSHFKYVFSKIAKIWKIWYLQEISTKKFLDLEKNKKVQSSLNLLLCYNMIPLTNKPPRVTRNTTNKTDHIITSTVLDKNDFKSTLIKTDSSDHFAINLCT